MQAAMWSAGGHDVRVHRRKDLVTERRMASLGQRWEQIGDGAGPVGVGLSLVTGLEMVT